MVVDVTIRRYRSQDCKYLAEIYYNTIHIINKADYTQEQLNAWAPKSSLDHSKWYKKFVKTNPFIAEITINGHKKIVGFAEFMDDGYIDCFYCHHDWLGNKIGSQLMDAILEEAINKRIKRIYADVSITAKPFFEYYEFIVKAEQVVNFNNVEMKNYKMERTLVK